MSVNKKQCTRCKEVKPLTEYYKKKDGRNGHISYCKVCKIKLANDYRILNSKTIKEKKKKYRDLNKEKIAKKGKERRRKNKEKNTKNPPEYTGKIKFKCYLCKQELIDTSFSRCLTRESGLSNICKPCDNIGAKKRIMKQPSGVYTIINRKNNRVYIGQAVALNRRKTEHFRTLRRGEHKNKSLQEDCNKHGIETFEFRIVEQCQSDEKRSVLYLKEIQKIIELQAEGKELYNLLILDSPRTI